MDLRMITILLAIYAIPTAYPLIYNESNYEAGLMFQKISDARVTYDSFALVYHSNLEVLFKLKDQVKELKELYDKFCNLQWNFCEAQELMRSRRLSVLLTNEGDINLYEQYKPTKHKRSIWMVASTAATSILGIINIATSMFYGKEIRDMKSDINVLRKIDNNGLIILKRNIITDRAIGEQTTLVLQNIIQQMNNMSTAAARQMSALDRQMFINQLDTTMNYLFLEHEYASGLILDHLKSALYGRLSHLVPMSKLREDLSEIEELLTEYQQLPIDIYKENPLNIFKHATTRASIFNKTLLIEVTIPKIDRDVYTLYKIIPIPIRSNDFLSILMPSTEYVLVDQMTAKFIPVIKEEFLVAPLNTKGEMIISPSSNIYHDYQENCEMAIKLNQSRKSWTRLCNFRTIPITNYFIALDSYNRYYVTISKPTNLVEFCSGSQVSTKYINESGFLTLSENCKVQTSKVTLRPRIKTIIDHESEIKLFNNLSTISTRSLKRKWSNITDIQFLTSAEPAIIIGNHMNDYDELANQADMLINQLADQSIFNDLHESRDKQNLFITIGMSSLLFLFVCIWGCSLYKKYCNIQTWIGAASMNTPQNADNNTLQRRSCL